MPWTSVGDGLPEEGVECRLSCMQADGSFVELIGYCQEGQWVIETDRPEHQRVHVRHWTPLASARKIV